MRMEGERRERKNVQNNLNPLTFMTISYNGDGDEKKEKRGRTNLSSPGSTFTCSRFLHEMMVTHRPCKFLLQVPIMTKRKKKGDYVLESLRPLNFHKKILQR
jgi:hypothetical protein